MLTNLRIVGLLVLLLAVHGWCKPAKNTEGEDYNDDLPEYSDEYNSQPEEESETAGPVEEPPQIISKPMSIQAHTGDTVTLPCLVANIEDLVVMWQKDNEILYSNSRALTQDSHRIIRLPNNSLVIHDVTVNDTSNNYICSILSNTFPGKITHRLLVKSENVSEPIPPPAPTSPVLPTSTPEYQSPLLIRVTPSETVVARQGETVTLGCHTSLEPPPEIKWYRKNHRIDSGDGIVEGKYLVLQKVTRHNAGLYQCLADNGVGKPPHAAINLIVRYIPEVEMERDWVHTGMGIESEMTCIVHAQPRARVAWFKNEKEVIPRKDKIVMKETKTRHTIKILDTKEHDLGKYTCIAANEMGEASKTISLTGAPSQATIYGGETTKDDTGLILKWRLESYSPITQYKLEYRRKGDNEWKVLEPAVTNGKGNQFTVEHPIVGLQPGSYEAILTARNVFGWSPPSIPHTFTGDYASLESKSGTTSVQPLATFIALLVLLSCVCTSL